MFRKVLSLVLALLMIASATVMFASCNSDESKKLGMSDELLPAATLTKDFDVPADFKIGMICLHDENSTYDNNFIKALKSVKEVLGLTDEQVLIATNIPETSACYDKAKEFAEKGCKIIFADSFGHEDFMVQAAEEFKDVQFCHATGTSASYKNKDVANFHNAFAAIYEGRYLAGIAAGLKLNEMIKNGDIKAEEAVIGYVGAFTYAEVISGMTSFYLGAKSVCASATMKVRYTGSWYDLSKEQEAANALIKTDKCVLISQHADSLGAPTACQLAEVPNISYNGSTYEAGEDTFIISSAINWAPYFLYIIKSVCKGTKIDKDWCGGIAEGSVVLSGINQDVAAEGTKAAIDEAIAKFKAGTLHVFDVTKDNYITAKNAKDAEVADKKTNLTIDANNKITEYKADVDGDFVGDTNVIHDGYFDESGKNFRSAPYFDIIIDGITNIS